MMPNSRQSLAGSILITGFAVLLGLFIGSCCPEDPFVPTPPSVVPDSSRQAYLRIVIADFDLAPVYVELDSGRLFCAPLSAFDYPEEVYEAQYWPVDTATSTISFVRTDGSILVSEDVSLRKGSYQTAYLYRKTSGEYDVLVTADDPTVKPGLGSVRYRIANFAVGAPEVDIIFVNKRNTSDVVRISNLGYGDTTEYQTQSTGTLPDGKSLTVVESATGDTIVSVPTVFFFGDAVNTLVMVGGIHPQGEEKFIFFNALQDSYSETSPSPYCNANLPLIPGTPLYGTIPIGLELAALRFYNAVSSGDTTLDLALQSQFGEPFPDRFRRNFPGQPESVIDVSPLGSSDGRSIRPYFFLSSLLEQSYPFRVEVHIAPAFDPTVNQPILIPAKPFTIEGGGRYTVIAYGPNAVGEAKTALLLDRVPRPPSGMSAFRLFHAAYGVNQADDLRLRVNGTVGPPMSYGEPPDPITGSFLASPSNSTEVAVLDPDGTVIASTTVATAADTPYTVILSRGRNGDMLVLTVVDDNIID